MNESARGWGLIKLVTFLVYLFMFAPIIVVLILSFNASQFGGFPMTGFSLHWYAKLMENESVVRAFQTSLWIGIVTALVCTAVGTMAALALVRYDFPGKRVLSALIDLPLSVSPIVVGLALVLVYNGRYGWFGPWLEAHGLRIIFAVPGMVMATCFVALPLIIREVVPVLDELGDDQEQAARSLGANAWQVFWRVTLPGIRWAIVYGVVLSLARSLGEFGAVKVVSGNVSGQSQVATVLVQQKYQNFEQETAYSVSFMLAFAAVLCLVVVALLRPKTHQEK